MASAELQRLWKLAQVDRAIQEVRARAAAMDVGQKIAAEIQKLESEESEVGGHARTLAAELSDLELTQKGLQDKVKKYEKDLFGGKLMSPREIETMEKEIAALKRQIASHDERVMELWDLVPQAKKAAAEVEARLANKKTELVEKRKTAMDQKTKLEEDFKRLTAARPQFVNVINNPSALARYDALRQKHAGIAMSEVTKKGTCGACGMSLPERTLQGLKEDKLITCEACHRILYWTDGLI